jgi:hypothetical protein
MTSPEAARSTGRRLAIRDDRGQQPRAELAVYQVEHAKSRVDEHAARLAAVISPLSGGITRPVRARKPLLAAAGG